MNPSVAPEERPILDSLDQLLRRPGVEPELEAIASRVDRKLAADPTATLAWAPVPLATYGGGLPAAVRSSWVFVLRARTTSGAERHPNSVQRVMSYRGEGDFQIWERGAWQSRPLDSARSGALERRWLSIPIDAWHKPVMGERDWVVVSFHTATESELIEERGDPEGGEVRRETYAARADSGSLGAR